jgi:very-short-patch-repair endonuclease
MNWYEKSKNIGRYRTISDAEKKRIYQFRDNPTPAEKDFWSMVRNKQIEGLKFRRQHKIGQFIVDFYCHQAKLVVEIDGSIHEGRIKEDAVRTKHIESFGLKVLRFTNNEVVYSPEIVREKVLAYISSIKNLPPSGARGVP